jgi:branched-chain amino acid transport system ATP-binding protein
MLSIGRALLTDPRLVVMDEPSEGLAPAIVAELTATLERLVADGLRVLVVEQNLGVATAIAHRLLVMLNGEIVDETTPDALERDPRAKQRYLGVTPRMDEGADSAPATAATPNRTSEGAQ